MKRICVILLLVLLLPGMLLGAGAALPDYYGESYYAELPAMVEKLRTTQGRKSSWWGAATWPSAWTAP